MLVMSMGADGARHDVVDDVHDSSSTWYRRPGHLLAPDAVDGPLNGGARGDAANGAHVSALRDANARRDEGGGGEDELHRRVCFFPASGDEKRAFSRASETRRRATRTCARWVRRRTGRRGRGARAFERVRARCVGRSGPGDDAPDASSAREKCTIVKISKYLPASRVSQNQPRIQPDRIRRAERASRVVRVIRVSPPPSSVVVDVSSIRVSPPPSASPPSLSRHRRGGHGERETSRVAFDAEGRDGRRVVVRRATSTPRRRRPRSNVRRFGRRRGRPRLDALEKVGFLSIARGGEPRFDPGVLVRRVSRLAPRQTRR